MGLTLVTPPATEPVTLTEAKLHLKVEHDADDDLIEVWITAAREWAETFTGRSFITTTWDLTCDRFPCPGGEIEIPRSPTQSVTSVTYVDVNGDSQVWDAAFYAVDTATEPARLVHDSEQAWPALRSELNAVTVRFVAGYGDADDVPKAIKAAILMLVGHWYEHRESVSVQEHFTVPMAVESLLYSNRVWQFR